MIAPELPMPDGSSDETFERQRRARIRQALDAFPRLAQAKADLEATARAVAVDLQATADAVAAGRKTPAQAASNSDACLQVLRETEGRVYEATVGIRPAFDVLLAEIAYAIKYRTLLDSDLVAWFVEGALRARDNLDEGGPPNLDGAFCWAAPPNRPPDPRIRDRSIFRAARVEAARRKAIGDEAGEQPISDHGLKAALKVILKDPKIDAERKTLVRSWRANFALLERMMPSEILAMAHRPYEEGEDAAKP
ncbi:MAG: hypothetical protein QM766_19145 [Burkholderiaceae bacterium]